MSTATVGFTPSQAIPVGSLLRLTYVLPGLQFDPLGQFPRSLSALWSALPQTANLYPANGPNVYPSALSATFDAREQGAKLAGGSTRARTGAQIIAALEASNDNAVELAKVELLSAGQVAESNGTQGALDRDAAAKQAAADAADNSWGAKLARELASLGSGLKWALIAVVIIVLAVAYTKAER